MKIPIKFTIIVEIPDELIHEQTHTNGTVTPPKPNSPKHTPKFRRGVPAPLYNRFGGITITDRIGSILAKCLEEGSIAGNDKVSYATLKTMTDAGLLVREQREAINAKGLRSFKYFYELTDLGLEALDWYQKNNS